MFSVIFQYIQIYLEHSKTWDIMHIFSHLYSNNGLLITSRTWIAYGFLLCVYPISFIMITQIIWIMLHSEGFILQIHKSLFL
jgi:hypothetical protein